jgi:hypothetical protein
MGVIEALTKRIDSAVGATENLGAKLGGGEPPIGEAPPEGSGSLGELLDEAAADSSSEVLTSYAVPVVRSAFDGGFMVRSAEGKLELTDRGRGVRERLRAASPT